MSIIELNFDKTIALRISLIINKAINVKRIYKKRNK